MEEPRKYLMDKFQLHLLENYRTYCEFHQIQLSYEGFVTYLIDHELISNRSLKHYTILKEFNEINSEYDRKTTTVKALSKCFNISVRSVWIVLKNDRKFEKGD